MGAKRKKRPGILRWKVDSAVEFLRDRHGAVLQALHNLARASGHTLRAYLNKRMSNHLGDQLWALIRQMDTKWTDKELKAVAADIVVRAHTEYMALR